MANAVCICALFLYADKNRRIILQRGWHNNKAGLELTLQRIGTYLTNCGWAKASAHKINKSLYIIPFLRVTLGA